MRRAWPRWPGRPRAEGHGREIPERPMKSARLRGRLEAAPGDLALHRGRTALAAVNKALGALRLEFRDRLKLAPAGSAGLRLGGRFPDVRMGRRGAELDFRPPPVHHAQGGAPGQARVRSQLGHDATPTIWSATGTSCPAAASVSTGGTSRRRIFRCLGYSDEETQRRFGHMLEAFEFGAPPHGGMAPGSTGWSCCWPTSRISAR